MNNGFEEKKDLLFEWKMIENSLWDLNLKWYVVIWMYKAKLEYELKCNFKLQFELKCKMN